MLSIVKYFKNIFHSYFLLQKVADLIFVQFLLQHRPNKVNSHMYSVNIFGFIYWFLFVFVGLKMWLRTVAWNHRYNLTYIAAKKKIQSHHSCWTFIQTFVFYGSSVSFGIHYCHLLVQYSIGNLPHSCPEYLQ